MKKIDGLPRTAYIIHCCKVLEDAAEYESDLVLVTIIRLYGFVEMLNAAIMSRLYANGISAPIWMQVASIQRELETYWATVPDSLKENGDQSPFPAWCSWRLTLNSNGNEQLPRHKHIPLPSLPPQTPLHLLLPRTHWPPPHRHALRLVSKSQFQDRLFMCSSCSEYVPPLLSVSLLPNIYESKYTNLNL